MKYENIYLFIYFIRCHLVLVTVQKQSRKSHHVPKALFRFASLPLLFIPINRCPSNDLTTMSRTTNKMEQ